ncbi:MAG TPA: hypothetical protein VFB06_11455 [Streptosporangiaceae bacterium]|nr:hypothetical protein [Streptosporangiaceae bacterium]
MTQAQWLVLLLKVFLISGFVTLAGWIALYSVLAPWWRNPVGRTLVAKTALIAALFIPTGLSLFFGFSRLDSYVAAWIQVSLIGLVTPVMIWRSAVWLKLHRAGRLPSNGKDGLADDRSRHPCGTRR